MEPSDIPAQHPSLRVRLADTSNCPIIASSNGSAEETEYVKHITSLFVSAQDTAARLGLGSLKRITVQSRQSDGSSEIGNQGGAFVQACVTPTNLRPNHHNESIRGKSKTAENSTRDSTQLGGTEAPPVLYTTVLASSEKDTQEAREVSKELEAVGRGVQEEWEIERQKGQGQTLESDPSQAESGS